VTEGLATQSEAFDEIAVAGVIDSTKVIQQPSPLPNQFEEPASGEMVFGVSFEMSGQVNDALRQERDLYFGGAGVRIVATVLLHRLGSAPYLLHVAHCFSLLSVT
jgi:hypothetical protein